MRGLPKIVLERLKRNAIGNQLNQQLTIDNQPSPHLDANLMAAFLERTLTEKERRLVLNHLAQCAECRELASLSLPSGDQLSQPASSPASRWWNAWPALRWGMGAAVLGAAAVVIVVHFHPWRRQETVSMAMRPTMASATRAASEPPAGLASLSNPEAALKKTEAGSHETPHISARLEKSAGQGVSRKIAPRPAGVEARGQMTSKAAGRPQVRVEAEVVDGSQASVTAVPANAGSAQAAKDMIAAQTRVISAPSNPAPPPPAPALTAARSRPAGLSGMALDGNLNRAEAPLAALWSIAPSGKVQRSQDRGKTWQEMQIDDVATFRAVFTTGEDVWAGGASGVLYHSSDGGARWKRLYLLSAGGNPTTETIVTITSRSRDVQHVVVRAESGEEWTTKDGGQHWQREP